VTGEVRKRFLPRFREIAAERLARMRAPDAQAVVAVEQLHALAGEASILGVTEVAEQARAAESRWRERTWASPEEWAQALGALEHALAQL
jgi:HPt (histidine-containing phosphotransfer) domain-containing protein